MKEVTALDKFSKGTGIVCEYNPFHKGHAYQIECVKNMGAQFVVCAMSGDFTQRAEAAFQDKFVRAENAVRNGADIVLEIPFPFSSMSAEGFAKAGVSVLEDSGLCSSLAFGSECADAEMLKKTADLLGPAFHKEVIALQKQEPNLAYAAARERLICERLGSEYSLLVRNPNDILAIEYLRANKTLCPIAIKRTTPRGGYDESFASSSYIRHTLFSRQDREKALSRLPENYSLENMYEDDSAFYRHVLVSLMQRTPAELSAFAEVQKGCEYSIVKNAVKAQSYEELCGLLSSKTLTDAKIRRMLLFSFFGVQKSIVKQKPLYTRVLCASEKGRKMLKKYADDRKIIVASRVSDIKRDDGALLQYEFSRKAGEILEKCRKIMQ